jgi:hypothetical protein
MNADCVLSTAHHDFQGLAMMDAIALGCVPIAPNRLAYTEYIPKQNLYAESEISKEESGNLANKIIELAQAKEWNPVDISNYSSTALWPKYHEVIGIS